MHSYLSEGHLPCFGERKQTKVLLAASRVKVECFAAWYLYPQLLSEGHLARYTRGRGVVGGVTHTRQKPKYVPPKTATS